jgi:hypothetical protein
MPLRWSLCAIDTRISKARGYKLLQIDGVDGAALVLAMASVSDLAQASS